MLICNIIHKIKPSNKSKKLPNNSDIDWAKQNKMLRDARWEQRGQPEKTVWWSI